MLAISKDKTQRGWSYPLKATVLDIAVRDAKLEVAVALQFNHGAFWSKRPLFSAGYYPSGSRHYNPEATFIVSCRSVRAEEYALAKHMVEATIIPQFIEWATELAALPVNSSRLTVKDRNREWNLA